MKTLPHTFLVSLFFASAALANDGENKPEINSIPCNEIGASAQAHYSGKEIGIEKIGDSYLLKTASQKLQGEVSTNGLSIVSTEDHSAKSFQLKANRMGRTNSLDFNFISHQGKVSLENNIVRYACDTITEEYSTSVDGVRQDYIINQKPNGEGRLILSLQLNGADAIKTSYGVKLAMHDGGREIAYSKLHVTDAAGNVIPAIMESDNKNNISISIDDSLATYPVRIDPTFSDADWVALNSGFLGANSAVRAMKYDGAGNLYVAGDFTGIGNALINRIAKWNGSTWSALGSGLNASVYALAMDGSGNLYAGGSFTSAGGVSVNYIAKWNGTTWSALSSGTSGYVKALEIDSSGNLYVGGSFTSAGGTSASKIAKWNGSAWSALGSGVSSLYGGGSVNAITITSSGNVYVGGSFVYAGIATANNIAMWNGSAWSALASGVSGNVDCLKLDSSGNLFVGGRFYTASGVTVNHIAKWNGTTWSALGTGVNDPSYTTEVYSIAFDSSGNLFAGGNFYTAGSVSAKCIAKWNGSTWASTNWTCNGGDVYALAFDGSGSLFSGGHFNADFNAVGNYIAKWDSSTWSPMGTGINSFVADVAIDNSGNLYIVGYFTHVGDINANHIAKWNGSAWSALGTGLNAYTSQVAVDTNNNVYAFGNFDTAGGISATHIAKWNGSAWSALGTGIDDYDFYAAALECDTNGNVYAGGYFTEAGGVAVSNIAKWNGSSWSSLGDGLTYGGVHAIALDQNGNVYAGGSFKLSGTKPLNYVAKWNGSSWVDLGTGVISDDEDYSAIVRALAYDTDGSLYVGGHFTHAGGVSAANVAKWDGSAWSNLGMGFDGEVSALVVDGSGNLYAGGDFSASGSTSLSAIAKWNGVEWSALGSGLLHQYYPGENICRSLAISSNGELYVGGGFELAGGKVSPYLAKAGNLNGSSPSVKVTSPIGITFSTTSSFSANGVASDNDNDLSLVQYRVNNGTWTSTSGTSSWSTTATLNYANNTVEFRATDALGNLSSIVTRNVLYLNNTTDTDGDGLNDLSEYQGSGFGFDWQVSQPTLVAQYQTMTNTAGYVTQSQMQALQVNTPLIFRNGNTNNFTLTLSLHKSIDLTTFTPMVLTAPQVNTNVQGKIEVQFTSPEPAAFFRVHAQ